MSDQTTNKRSFYHALANTLFVSVVNSTIWFAVVFYAYIETKSVLVTGVAGGIYLVLTALTGFWLGSFVDHFRKRTVLLASTIFSLVFYILTYLIYLSQPSASFTKPESIWIWMIIVPSLIGVIAGNLRGITMPTLVSMLVPPDERDKANGLVGTITGVSFMATSAISGILVAKTGMHGPLVLAIIISVLAIIHLLFIKINERTIVPQTETDPQTANSPATATGKVDVKGTVKVIMAIPGLMALIVFSTTNNFLGGVFMALMDAYGIDMVGVEWWGFLLSILSSGFIIGGLLIAKKGLGKNPLKTIFVINLVTWTVCIFFTIQAWLPLFLAGMMTYMVLMPFIEASEQTVLQKVVPLERQGRVFGFAQSVEQAASPLTAFLIGPLTQLFFIPFMTDGLGAQLIGGWFGTGQARGIALVFTITGIIGLVITALAMRTKYYRQLSDYYLSK